MSSVPVEMVVNVLLGLQRQSFPGTLAVGLTVKYSYGFVLIMKLLIGNYSVIQMYDLVTN